jgi:hypothetical protein
LQPQTCNVTRHHRVHCEPASSYSEHRQLPTLRPRLSGNARCSAGCSLRRGRPHLPFGAAEVGRLVDSPGILRLFRFGLFKLKVNGGEDLPYRRSGTGVVNGTLKFDVHVRNNSTPQTRHLAGSEADRNYTGVVAIIKIPDTGRSKIVSVFEVVVSEWLYPYNLCGWTAGSPGPLGRRVYPTSLRRRRRGEG